MQAAATPRVVKKIRKALEDESATTLRIRGYGESDPLTVNDARRIIACLANPRFDTLEIDNYSLHDPAVLNVFRDGLPLCTSVTKVILWKTQLLENEELDCLRLAFYNASIMTLDISRNNIQGQHGGQVLRDLLVGNNSVIELILRRNPICRLGARGLGQGLAGNTWLLTLDLRRCDIGNEALTSLLLSMGTVNNMTLTYVDLSRNKIEGADGGQQLTLLLQRFPALKVFNLEHNYDFGPLGGRALAPGLTAASHLETLNLRYCYVINYLGIDNILPDGQVNRSLTDLNLGHNQIEGEDGGRQVSLLMLRCSVLKVLKLDYNSHLGPLGVRALAPGLAAARHLETLDLWRCGLGNDGVANLVTDGQVNRSLTKLNLGDNNIQDEDGGGQVSLLLQHCPTLKVLDLHCNRRLGPLGARALAPGLAATIHLELLNLRYCGLGNDGVVNLIPEGQENRSLTNLDLSCNDIPNWNNIEGLEAGENVIALVSRCMHLDSFNHYLMDDAQRHCLYLLLDRNRKQRLCTEAEKKTTVYRGQGRKTMSVYRGLGPWWFHLPNPVSICGESTLSCTWP